LDSINEGKEFDMAKGLTQAEAIRRIRRLTLSVTIRDGEIRVAYPLWFVANRYPEATHQERLHRIEALAYYTTDLQDAVDTAERMYETGIL
jgi:hypothetical protein